MLRAGSQSYLQMKTLSAALEQSEEIMQWINVISARARVELQVGLQFLVCCGRREALLSILGRVYLSGIVSEFGPLRGPRPLSLGEKRGSRGGTLPDAVDAKIPRRRGPSPSPTCPTSRTAASGTRTSSSTI